MNLPEKIAKKKLLLAILTGAVVFLGVVLYFNFKHPIQDNPQPLVKQEETTLGLPILLKIPKIQVEAKVELVGLTPEGTMGVPKGPDEVAWYQLGTRPGEKGSAVIAGHYGTWKNGSGSVFDKLHKLRPGDKLSIEDDKGATISFVVRESRRFDPKADAVEVFSSDDDKSHLNLITCEGTWNKDAKSYSQRLVVFTDKVDPAD